MATHHSEEVPVIASEAVLIRSEPMPEGTPTVKGNNWKIERKIFRIYNQFTIIEYNKYLNI
jgi:hypothetical protein